MDMGVVSVNRSRFPKFYRHSVSDRLKLLYERSVITEHDYHILLEGNHLLTSDAADKMVENVVGVFGLPIGLGLNFLINGKDYVVPMVVEEPSIVAGVSSAAKLIRLAGGFKSVSTDPILIGQIQVVGVQCGSTATHAILQNKNEIINLANGLHPKMVARGGGAKDLEVTAYPSGSVPGDMLVVHLLVDTRDAMGANVVNSMCEGVSALIEKITHGKVILRILSNLTDRSMVRAKAVIPAKLLESRNYSGEEVRDRIILANHLAIVDPYRAATHNKGIMNGIDAVAIATGNDWRAIEAAAHAYAARGSSYVSLTRWFRNESNDLSGILEIPLKVGIVGGTLQSNPAIGIMHQILNIESARELGEVMAAVGLAQNFAALRALVTEGIQRGHMTLHARNIVMAAGAEPDIFDEAVEELIKSGEIKIWKAREIIENIRLKKDERTPRFLKSDATGILSEGRGKIIISGEHAVVYGSHAIAAPISLAVHARVVDCAKGVHLLIPRWGVEEILFTKAHHKYSVYRSLQLILKRLGLDNPNIRIEVFPQVPRAVGLGASAALAVAIIRALSDHFKLDLSAKAVCDIAYGSEKIVHGTPSGIDNTVATYGKFILFRKGRTPVMKEIHVPNPIPIVIGLSGVESLTYKMVAKVRRSWEKNKPLYDSIFKDIDLITLQSYEAIQFYDLKRLGELMNVNQGLLNSLQVSSLKLEELIQIARNHGALGAKLTGGGGGGAMIALCPDNAEQVAEAMKKSGSQAIVTTIGSPLKTSE
jgi:hydroxymethylglutaryl-CoA reductase